MLSSDWVRSRRARMVEVARLSRSGDCVCALRWGVIVVCGVAGVCLYIERWKKFRMFVDSG